MSSGWNVYQSDIIEARELSFGAIDHITDNFVELLRSGDGRLGDIYVDRGLIDELLTDADFQQKVLEYVEEHPDHKGQYRTASLKHYLAEQRLAAPRPVKDENIAVVVAAGTIMNGSQPPGTSAANRPRNC